MKKFVKKIYYGITKAYHNTLRIYSYFSLIRLHKKNSGVVRNDEKIVIFYFSDRSLLSSSFAYYYFLIIGFIKNNYKVILDIAWKDSRQINDQNRILFFTKGLFLGRLGKHKSNVEIVISDNPNLQNKTFQNFITYDPDILNKVIDTKSEIIQPFSIHPHKFNQQVPDFKRERRVKIFFSGNCDESYYNKASPWNLMNRYEVISFIKEKFSEILLSNTSGPRGDNKEYSLIIQDWSWNHNNGGYNTEFRVPNKNWLEFLSNTSFFISPPGVNIPFSHNIIEAMLVGSIPITNYGQLFSPPLVNNVNCMAFSNKEELNNAINKALSMKSKEIDYMRKNVINYYHQYLDPKNFVSKIMANTEIKKVYYYATNLTESKSKQREKHSTEGGKNHLELN